WEILVARAPMRPEAVVGLLRAYTQSGKEQEAARVYSEYLGRLRQSGIAQPADSVQQLVARHPKLQELAAKAPAPPEAASAVRSATPPAAPARRPEPTFTTAPPAPPPRAAPGEPPPVQEPPIPKVEPGIVAGFQPGASPPESAEAPPRKPKAASDAIGAPDQEEAWRDIVEMTAEDELDLSVAEVPAAPKDPSTKPAKPTPGFPLPGTREPAPPEPGSRLEGRTVRRKPEQDDAIREASAAARDEFRDVPHKVTSVRKAWGPVLRETWEELGPWRAVAAEQAARGLRWMAAALAALPGLLWRFLRAAARLVPGAGRALPVSRRRSKAAGPATGRVVAPARARRRRAAEVQEALTQPLESELEPLDAVAEPLAAEAPPVERVEIPPEPVAPAAKPFERMAEPIEPAAEPFELFAEPVEPAAKPVKPAPRPVKPVARPVEAAAKPFEVLARPRKRRRARRRGLALVKRYWFAPVALALVGLGIAFGPDLVVRISGLRSDLPEVRAPSLPRVSLPRVTLRTPAFVETSISRIGAMFSGPLLEEPGQWVVVADVEVDDEARADYPLTAMTVALEAELQQARFFSVVPRERALIARRRHAGSTSDDLGTDDAVALAEADGYAAVIVARLSRAGGVDSVAIRVLSPVGEELYGVAAEVSGETSALETMVGLTRPVRRRLGEPQEQTEESLPATQILSASPPALDVYSRARMHLFAGRYSEAIASAQEATRHDSSFAMAYRLLAEAYALSGRRTLARSALDSAVRLSDRASERERWRILADRHAWDGRYSDAAVTYERLFQRYRDDVGALKSLALLQRIIGVRGGGEGNLRVAYTIDPYDWPPLSRVARYLGYSGRLPDVDSLVATLEGSP
ncbi:MAG: hypothetical protein JSV41_02150, partial [Gemmatimonadota bacterium]